MATMRMGEKATWLSWVLLVSAVASTARADRVVVYAPGGAADDERRAAVFARMNETLTALGHQVISGTAIQQGGVSGLPRDSEPMMTVAAANQAQWVVLADVSSLPGQYRLHLVAAYVPSRRVEQLDVNVIVAEETERMRDVLASMIRAEGLGDDALRLTGEDPAAAEARRAAEAAAAEAAARLAAEQQRQEAETAAQREALAERERQRAAEARAAAAAAFEARPRYAADPAKPWLGQVGLGVMSLAAVAEGRSGGWLWDLQLRGGYGINALPGLEARFGLDIVGGASSGFSLVAGAVYLASFFSVPVYIGGGAELGLFLNTTGARDAGFLFRFGPVASWRVGPNFFFEGLLPEITYLGIADGVVGIGMSVRGGMRF